ncbi:hypothetical protein MMC17_008040 [Xylographa soralifera]|nr:hypothetical protein [Xylographa soralifera]
MHPLHVSQSRAAHSHYRASTSATFLRLPLPSRESLITSLEYWTQEAAAYRIWTHQMSVTPTWFKSPFTDEEGGEVTWLKSSIMDAEREHKRAEQVASSFGSALPSREVLIDNENYWETEAEAWRVWRNEAETKWVDEGESRANVYIGGAVESSGDRSIVDNMKNTSI